jgi:cell division protein FtsI (penicillin-binding protein 3)
MLMFSVLGGRLIQLQITDADAYAAKGLKERLTPVILPAPRGAILDRTGAVLAHSVEARYVYADPPLVEEKGGGPSAAAEKLSPFLGISKTELWQDLQVTRHADGEKNRFVILRRGLDVATGDLIAQLNIPGIVVDRDTRREIPGNDLAANIIGFANQEGHGAFGLESAYDDVLYGKDGRREFEVSTLGQEIPSGFHRERAAKPGSNLRLTIDRDLQFETQRLLTERMARVGARFSCAMVLDVKTGELLAMASTPTYNAADPQSDIPADTCSQVTIDPGSIHKAITIGGALQEGVVTPDTLVFTEPTIKKGDTVFEDTHWHDPRLMTLPGIFAHSSNVGTIHIADQLGAQKLYEYQLKFGLGKPTGLGLPGEASGLVQPPANWSGSSYGSIPIGMSVSVTPVQMAAAYTVIANDGMYVQPNLVQGTIPSGGQLKPAPKAAQHRVLDVERARQLRSMLEAVTGVDDGTGVSARIPGYRVAGKTGTGKYIANGKYRPGEVASFIGMAPAEAPRYVVAVFAYTPGGEGGAVASPVFKDVMSFTLRKYGVPPTDTKAPDFRVYG